MKLTDLLEEFKLYYEQYKQSGNTEPSAMSLSTATKTGKPSCRIVLLKSIDDKGFVFYTNYNSRKSREIQENPVASLTFFWHELGRQIRVEGRVEKVSSEESDAYFDSRDRKSRIGAWASKQSSEIEGKLDFEKRIAKYSLKYALGKIPRPEFWGGYRVIPDKIEFWLKKDYRLHERRIFSATSEEDWSLKKIYP
jgi:pyridoxamine 5'-phosphate oxidase